MLKAVLVRQEPSRDEDKQNDTGELAADGDALAESSILADICDNKVLKAFVMKAVAVLSDKQAAKKEQERAVQFLNLFEDLEEKIAHILREEQVFHVYWLYLLSRHRTEEAAINLVAVRSPPKSVQGQALYKAIRALIVQEPAPSE